MIKKIIAIFLIIVIAALAINTLNSHLYSFSPKPPSATTGSPGDGGTTCASGMGCHSDFSATVQTGWITSTVPSSGYIPDTTYTITLTGTHTGVNKFGFEITAEDNTNSKKGTFIITNTAETQPVGTGYVSHTLSGMTPSGNTKSWNIDWTAPPSGTGDITFYAALNAANGNGFPSGDSIYTTTLAVKEDTTLPTMTEDVFKQNNFKLFPNPVSDHFIVSFYLDQPDNVSIEIYNIKGSKVAVLLDVNNASGNYVNTFNISEILNSGLYFIKVKTGDEIYIEKIIVE